VDNVARIARYEEEYQLLNARVVEGGHDVDRNDYLYRLATARAFVRLSKLP